MGALIVGAFCLGWRDVRNVEMACLMDLCKGPGEGFTYVKG